ncbi:MAG: AraC family transcriptional regulator [Paenibacillaceae bacterium]|nr:AraC family transcriptional regulator [Paenibacillaceae bacterium]
MPSGCTRIRTYQFFLDKPQFQLEADSYGDAWSAFAIESGSFDYRIGDKQGTAGPGSVVLCPPETLFHRRTSRPISFHFFIFHWVAGEQESGSVALPAGRTGIANTERVLSSLALLRATAGETGPLAREWQNHLLTDILRLYLSEQQFAVCSPQQQDEVMANAWSYIQQTYAGTCTLEQLADRCNLSPVQFSRRFKSAFRINPSDFIRRLRLQKAVSLLTQTELTIDSVAQQCGYSNGFYLSRVFREHYKMSPSAYRKVHRV